MEGKEGRASRILLSSAMALMKYGDNKAIRGGGNSESTFVFRSTQQKDVTALSVLQSAWRPPPATSPTAVAFHSNPNSRPSSPYARRPSPPRSTTPTFSRSVLESLRKSNETLKQDMCKLQKHVESLKQKCEAQEAEIHKLQRQSQEAASIAAAESSRSRVPKEAVRSIATQIINELVPEEMHQSGSVKAMYDQIEVFLNANEASENYSPQFNLCNENGVTHHEMNRNSEMESRSSDATTRRDEGESMEQFEPGVYVTFIQHPNGVKIFKRVKFSKKRFKEHEAEIWWKENKDRLLKRYRQAIVGNQGGATTELTSTSANPEESSQLGNSKTT